MRQVRRQISGQFTLCGEGQPADLCYEPPNLESIGELLRRIDVLLSE